MAINLKDLMTIEIEMSIEETNSLFEGNQARMVIGGTTYPGCQPSPSVEPPPPPGVSECQQRTGCDGRDPEGCDWTHFTDRTM